MTILEEKYKWRSINEIFVKIRLKPVKLRTVCGAKTTIFEKRTR